MKRIEQTETIQPELFIRLTFTMFPVASINFYTPPEIPPDYDWFVVDAGRILNSWQRDYKSNF